MQCRRWKSDVWHWHLQDFTVKKGPKCAKVRSPVQVRKSYLYRFERIASFVHEPIAWFHQPSKISQLFSCSILNQPLNVLRCLPRNFDLFFLFAGNDLECCIVFSLLWDVHLHVTPKTRLPLAKVVITLSAPIIFSDWDAVRSSTMLLWIKTLGFNFEQADGFLQHSGFILTLLMLQQTS